VGVGGDAARVDGVEKGVSRGGSQGFIGFNS
jgi:hypothetical protein